MSARREIATKLDKEAKIFSGHVPLLDFLSAFIYSLSTQHAIKTLASHAAIIIVRHIIEFSIPTLLYNERFFLFLWGVLHSIFASFLTYDFPNFSF